jgi:hypothetical protein
MVYRRIGARRVDPPARPEDTAMNFSPELKRYFEKSGVHVDRRYLPRGIVVLNNVPVSRSLVSKPRTNLCAATDPASGISVWVDADLQPASAESAAAPLLSGRVNESWQRVSHAQAFTTHEQAITTTIELLGGTSPREAWLDVPRQTMLAGRILPALGHVLELADGERNLVGRDNVLHAAERFVRHGARTVVFGGESGAGMTTCAIETLRRRLKGSTGRVVRVDCALVATEMIFPASTDERFRQLLAECLADTGPETWFLFDNLQWTLRFGPLAQSALATALERGLRCVATCQIEVFSPGRLLPMLARRLHWIALPPFDADDLREILRQRAEVLAHDSRVTIPPETLTAAIRQGAASPGADPARTLSVLEAAVALAEVEGVVGPDEVAAAVGASMAR